MTRAVKLLATVLVWLFALHGAEANTASVSKLKVSSQTEKAVPLRPEVFGVHGELLWNRVRIGSTAFEEAYDELGFKFIRLPGGTTANLYLWQIPRFDCNGELSKKKLDRAPGFNAALGKKGRTYSLEDFSTFLKNSGTSFSYVVNVICDSPESTLKLARRFKEAGVELTRAEMGNELNFPEYIPSDQAGKEYVAMIQPHIKAIHEVFPKAKIGGVVSTASFRSLRFPNLKAMRKNKRDSRDVEFDEAVAADPLVTAFVPHMYSTFGLSPGSFFSLSGDEITTEKIYLNSIAHFDRRTKAAIDYFSNLRPDAEVWITEWGVAFWGETRKYALDFNTSHFSSLYFVNALSTYMLLPSITATSYHNFPNFMAVSPGFGKDDQARVSLFHAARLMSSLFSDAAGVVTPLSFAGGKAFKSQHKDFPGMVSASTGVEVTIGDLKKILIVNKTSGEKEYDLGNYCSEEVSCVAESLFHVAKSSGGRDFSTSNHELAADSIKIPGYSFSVITVRKR